MHQADGKRPIARDPAVLIVGPHSSGKTTLARALTAQLRGTRVEMGDVVRSEARRRGEHNLVLLADDLLSGDPTFIARSALAHLTRLSAGPVVLVGPRTASEFRLLTDSRPFLTVGIAMDDWTRRSRWLKRNLRFSDTWEDRESREKRWETRELVRLCELIIDGTIEPSGQVKAVMTELSREWHGPE